MLASELMGEIRDQARERERRGQSISELSCLLSRAQYEMLRRELHRVCNEPTGGPTTVMNMPIFVVGETVVVDPPTLWKGDPPAFASEVNAAVY